MISIIHPSRGRPQKSAETIFKWLNKAANPNDIEIILSFDLDDPMLETYKRIYPLHPGRRIIMSENKSAVEAINIGAKFSKGNILIVVSDDTDCPEHWDVLITHLSIGGDDWIVKFKDGIQPWVITMPVMDRKYYERFGYIYHPSYKHCFCDTELSCVAELTKRLITSTVLFNHNHYSIGKSEKDEVSIKADATFEEGKRNFIERKARNFDLAPEQIKGRLSDNVYTRMV